MWPLILTACIVTLASCFKIEDKIITQTVAEEITAITLEYMVKEDLNYEEAFKKALEDLNIKMGDKYYIADGEEFHTNSLHTGTSKTMGEEFEAENKHEGMYPISGFAIVRKSDNELIAYIEDFYGPSSNKKLSEFIEESLKGTGIGYDEIRIEIHFGVTNKQTGERSRLGWIENGNLIIDEESIQKSIEDIATYKGKIENFSGDTITITTKDGKVTIPVKDENGNYYKPGTVVKGDNGKEYEISTLFEDEKKETIERQESIVDGKKLTFNIKNCSLLPAVPLLAAALVNYLKNKRENEKSEKDPYYEFKNEEELDEYYKKLHEDAKKFGEIHKVIVYSPEELEEALKDAYYQQSGIKVDNLDDLMYFLHNNRILIVNKTLEDTTSYDITNYVENYLEKIIITKENENNRVNIQYGYDKEAAEYFEGDSKGGRGR